MPLYGTVSGSNMIATGSVSNAYVFTVGNDATTKAHGLQVMSDGTGTDVNVFDVGSRTGDDDAQVTHLRVRGDGRVGIGKVTSLPTAKLTIDGSSLGGDNADLSIAGRVQHLGDSDTNFQFPANNTIQFIAGGINQLYMRNVSAEGQVLVLSGGSGDSVDPKGFPDVNFFVSGSLGTRGSTTKGAAAFGGDLVASGGMHVVDEGGAGITVAKKLGFTFDLALNSSDPSATSTQNVRAGRITFTVNGSISNNASLGWISILSNQVSQEDVIVCTAGVTSENRYGVDASATAIANGAFMIMLANYTGQTLSNDSTFTVNWAAI